jgi:uncharacterized membrane protein
MADAVQKQIETYLSKLREGLHGMKEADADEILRELRSHIADKARAEGEMTEASVEAALAALGSPGELAKEYRKEQVLTRMEASRSPMRILDGLFHWASLSVAGFFALLGSLLGYGFGLVFMLVAVLKPFHPNAAGLWKLIDKSGEVEFSVRLGFGPVPQNGQELLSWWIVPIGLGVGFVCLLLTTSFARWYVRLFRRSRTLPGSI